MVVGILKNCLLLLSMCSVVHGMDLIVLENLFDTVDTEQKNFFAMVFENNVEQAKALFARNNKLVNSFDQYGLAPLHWAALFGHVEMTDFLITAQANVNLLSKGVRSVLPLHLAVGCGKISHDWLRKPDMPMWSDNTGNVNTYVAVVQKLLNAGANPCINEGLMVHESVFSYACEAGVRDMVIALLLSEKIDRMTLKQGLAHAYLPEIKNEISGRLKASKKRCSIL